MQSAAAVQIMHRPVMNHSNSTLTQVFSRILLHKIFEVELDFSELDVTGSYPNSLHGQGFTILCGGCMKYINFIFDASTTSTLYNDTPNAAEDGTVNTLAREFRIGVQSVKNGSELAEAIFNGVLSVSGQIKTGYGTTKNNANNLLVDANHNVRIKKDLNGKIFISKNRYDPALQLMGGTITNPLTLPLLESKIDIKPENPLWIQHAHTRDNAFMFSLMTCSQKIWESIKLRRDDARKCSKLRVDNPRRRQG